MIIGEVVTIEIEGELHSGVILKKSEVNVVNHLLDDVSGWNPYATSFIYKVLVGDKKLFFTKNSFL